MQIDPDEDEQYLRLLALKGKRARRRELEQRLEAGRLQVHFNNQRYEDGLFVYIYPTVAAFKQLMRSYKHSCHAGCCAVERWERRNATRNERHRCKMALRRGEEPFFDRAIPLS